MKARENLLAWIFNLPTLFILGVVVAIPILEAAYISFLFYNLKLPKATRFIGLSNYISLLQDPLFWYSLRVTATFV
ncbi:ABC transporter permease, partial [Candidatus Bathyarchaeota archaeon B24-2]